MENINFERFMTNLKIIGEIGINQENGIDRLAFSDKYYEALEKLSEIMLKENIDVKKDRIGNISGLRNGIKKNKKTIMIGSHLDTVKNGGLYDGNLGVISSLEIILSLSDNKKNLNHPIEILAFNAEEGSEMGGTFGSRVMTGRQNINEKGIEEKLSVYGLNIEDIKKSEKKMDDKLCFVELHIEQGGILEKNNCSIGIVTGIVGINRYKIIINGEANHAGTTPMSLRRDAMTGAAKLITFINEEAFKYGESFVATVGNIKVFPGAVNVIPGKVEFLLEVRDMEEENIVSFVKKVEKYSNKLIGSEVEFIQTVNKPSMKMDTKLNKILEKICKKNNINYILITSGAGHDAKEFANKIPTTMIFVPSCKGISHSPKEYTEEKDIEIGVNLFYDFILEIDKEFEN
ncbi:M20 family metallo-hydrolase [Fusobacterium sp. THCT1E2]